MSEQKNTAHDNAVGWAIMGCIFAALAFMVWYYFEYQIKDVLRWFRWSQIWAISQVVTENYSVTWNDTALNYKQSVDNIADIPQTGLNNEMMGVISYIAMKPLLWPITAVLAGMAGWAMFRGPKTQYRKKMNLNQLLEVQSKNFPALASFIDFNPSDIPPRPPGSPVPAELPLFAEALGPEEWVAYNEIPIPDGEVDEEAAFIAFSKQLGPRWQGAMRLAPYKQILLAAFCLKAARKRVDSDTLIGRLSYCWSHDKGLQLSKDKALLKDARAILRDKKLSGETLALCNQHAFQTTALIRALQTARDEGGVLASAQFIFLRGYDRALWYPLNNLGRQALHMEAVGAMAHYKAEKRTERPIPRPKMGEAVRTITEYMQSSKARPVPQLDYSNAKKRGIKQPKQNKNKAPNKSKPPNAKQKLKGKSA